MSNWEFTEAEILYNKVTDGTHDSPKYTNEGYPLVTSKNIKDGILDLSSANLISKHDYEEINKRSKVEQWDVIISMIGEYCGYTYIEKSNLIKYAVKNVGLFKTCSELEANWLSYYLKSDYGKHFLKQSRSGSSQPYISLSALRSLKILNPVSKIKEGIVNALKSLDAKIELNNNINAELEAMAKTLYDYWFVQFEFPNDKGKPYKSSGGKMLWNEELKREVPEGWEVKLFSEWINNDKSGDWGKEQIEGNYTEKVYCIRGADINGLNGLGELKSPERYILEKNLHKTLDPADLIVEISGGSPTQSTGRLAFITEETLSRFDAPIICSNFCKAVTLKNKTQLYNFVYHWKSIYDAGVLFGYEGKTSGIKNLLFESFVSSHYTVVPEKSATTKFHTFMEQLESKKQKNLKEIQKLTELRDWLLPMLMNGQVKVG